MTTDPNAGSANTAERRGFPVFTAGLALVTLFAFLALTWAEAKYGVLSDALKGEPKAGVKGEPEGEPKAEAPDLDEIKKRNEAALAGVGAKMSQSEARAKLLSKLKGPKDELPFPTPELAAKKDTKKDEKEKKP